MKNFSAVALVLCLCVPAFAQTPFLAVDLDTSVDQVNGSKPDFVATVNGVAVFTASPTTSTPALWRTDGTAAGTYKLLDLGNALFELGVSGAVVSGNTLYFATRTASREWAIWRTDGTVAGTVAVSGSDSDDMMLLAVDIGLDKGRIFHLRERTRELWVTDSAGDRRLATLRNGTSSLNVPIIWNNNFYLGMETGIWKSNGTPEGTVKLVSQAAYTFAVLNDMLFFTSFRADAGGELFATDGTEAGTRLVADIRPGTDSTFGFGSASALRSLGTRLFFRASNGDIGVSDGTAAGTRVLHSGRPSNTPPAVLNGVAYFPFDDGEHGVELWRSDGTEAGTRMVVDGTPDGSSAVTLMAAGATKIYFYGSMGQYPTDIFESDGTASGTRVLPAPRTPAWRGIRESRQLVTSGDSVFFGADDGIAGNEPWASSNGNTRLLANLANETPGSSDVGDVVAAGNRLLFRAKDDAGWKLWVSDGTRAGTQPIFEVGDRSDLSSLGVLGSTVFYKVGLAKLYKSDGTREGTVLLRDFGPSTSAIGRMYISAGRAYLIALGSTSGWELWTTDGTAEGTIRLHADASSGSPVVELAGRSYFVDDNDVVFTTDGTVAGTRAIAPLPGDENGGLPVAFRGALYVFGRKLYRLSTGTGDLTPIVDLQASVTSVASIGTELLFMNVSGELWKTNGTAAGTVKVRDLPNNLRSSMTGLHSLGNRVVFAFNDAQLGYEPWVSDGTAEGTKLLRDIQRNDIQVSSFDMEFFVADGIAYFGAISTETGWELWQTDGTPEGTILTADIAPGPEWSILVPGEFSRIGNTIYFGATTPAEGRELWAYPLPERVSVTIDDVRVAESEGGATLTVRLSRAFSRRVTVSYQTLDETARAGHDYTEASGTLTFEPGETSKSIDVLVADDAAPNGVRALLVKLSTADAAQERSIGAVVIEDDDVVADLSLLLASTWSGKSVVVQNLGPSPASNVVLCAGLATASDSGAMECAVPVVLAPGVTFSKSVSSTRGTLVASVTHLERDPNPANNRKSWLLGSFIHADPAVAVAGTTGALIVTFPTSSQPEELSWSSSDPSVVSVPAVVTYPANASSIGVGFNPLKAGTATITMTSFGWGTERVTIRVVEASQTPRLVPVVALESFTAWTFGASNTMTVRVNGATPDGAKPTGTVTLFDGGTPIGTLPVVDRQAVFAFTTPPLGTHNFTAAYSGDAKFYDVSSAAREVFVRRGAPSIRAVRVDDSTDVMIIVSGVPSHPPTGTVTVGTNPARALAAWNGSSASATVSGIAADARTITLSYSGDDKYNSATVTIPIASQRGRAVRH